MTELYKRIEKKNEKKFLLAIFFFFSSVRFFLSVIVFFQLFFLGSGSMGKGREGKKRIISEK